MNLNLLSWSSSGAVVPCGPQRFPGIINESQCKSLISVRIKSNLWLPPNSVEEAPTVRAPCAKKAELTARFLL